MDATFSKAEYLEIAKRAAKREGNVTIVVLCSISDADARKRIEERKAGASDADFGIYLKIKKEFEAIGEDHLKVDCSKSLHEVLEQIIEYVGEMNEPRRDNEAQ